MPPKSKKRRDANVAKQTDDELMEQMLTIPDFEMERKDFLALDSPIVLEPQKPDELNLQQEPIIDDVAPIAAVHQIEKIIRHVRAWRVFTTDGRIIEHSLSKSLDQVKAASLVV